MPERNLFDQLDLAVAAALEGRVVEVDAAVAGAARVARELADLPRQSYRARLREELERKARDMTATIKRTGVPKGYTTVTPYLQVRGGAELLEFVKTAWGAVETVRTTRPDGSLGHSEARLGDSMLMIGESGGEFPAMPACLHYYVEDADDAYRRAVEAGATSLYEPMDQPYGDREAGVTDAAGNSWFIATHKGGASHVPEGLGTVTPYLILEGVPKVIEFVERAFGAATLERYEAPEGVVRHAKLRIGGAMIEMGEAQASFPAKPAAIYLYVDDADTWFARAMAAGAAQLYPVVDHPYGDRGGGVTDPFGNIWYIGTHLG